jgi:D-alanine-D-alanine ligase
MVKGRVRTAESRVTRKAEDVRAVIDDMLSRHDRIVLKPLAGGSSRGLFFLDRGGDIDGIAEQVIARRTPYIIEQFLRGRELTCGVLDQGEGPFALPVIEIEVDPNRAFDYEGKYLGSGTREICPANIPDEMTRDAQQTALEAHLALGCEGYSRTDLMATEDGVYFLETNTLPGMTTSSLVPQELRAVGIDFRAFLEGQLALAVSRSQRAAA